MSYAPKDRRGRGWWPYMKYCIRQYNSIPIEDAESDLEQRELDAVRRAIVKTRSMKHGETRLELIDKVYWKRTHNVMGAAMELYISERTALRWHGEFIRAVAKEFFGDSITVTKKGKGEDE